MLTEEIFEKLNQKFNMIPGPVSDYETFQMVGLDFITPHNSPTKEPVPIRIIKVMPDVQFEFRFKLNAGFDESIISAQDPEEKIKKLFELFKELLKLFGAGAKTNVGYGVLEEVN